MSYTSAHLFVSKVRGAARTYGCVMDGCTSKADEWSYDHQDPHERTDDERGRPYSTDPDRYRPMCRPCHLRYDQDHRGLRKCLVAGCSTFTDGDYCAHLHTPGPKRRRGVQLGHSFGEPDECGRVRPAKVVAKATVTEKRCSRCEQVKPAAAFSSNRTHSTGLASKCLPCDRAASAERYRARRAQRLAASP